MNTSYLFMFNKLMRSFIYTASSRVHYEPVFEKYSEASIHAS